MKPLRDALRFFVLLCFFGVAYAGTTTLIDPTQNPIGFFDQLVTFAHTSWPLAIAFALYGLTELAAALKPKWSVLGKGRISIVIAGLGATLGAGLHAYLGGGSLQPAFFAAAAALLAFWHPAAADVAKKQEIRVVPPPIPKAAGGFVKMDGLLPLALVTLGGIACGLIAFAWIASASGCSGAQRAAEKHALSCMETDLIKDLTPTAESILLNGGKSWEQQLEALGLTFGKDAIGCATRDAGAILAGTAPKPFQPPATVTPGPATVGVAPTNPDAAARAAQYLKDHGLS